MQTIITCHHNADYDAVAALVGALCLYPGAKLLFPGTQERQLQELYDNGLRHMYHVVQAKELQVEEVERLVVVDTSQADRVPHAAVLLEAPHVEVHVWDHHPDKPSLPRIVFQRIEPVGSTSTLLTEELMVRGLDPGCDIASLLGMGIYGDTGSFNYASTGARDFRAAAQLHEWGMDVNFIATMLRYELSREQLNALNQLLDTAELHDLEGVSLAIATANLEGYLNDFAILATRFASIQPCDVFFGLGAMEDKIQVVARSRAPGIDVGAICKKLGGGGHPTAAAAGVRNLSMPEIKDVILGQLSADANPHKVAGRLMSSPAVGVEASSTLREAETTMARYGLKAVPVYYDGTRICAGWLEHQLAVRAVSHGLGQVDAAAYMQRNFQVLTAGDGLQALMDIIVGDKQRLVPVVEGPDMPERYTLGDSPEDRAERQRIEEELRERPVLGVVTRTDLIRIFTEDGSVHLPKPRRKKENSRNLKKTMQARLAPQVVSLLELAGRLGDEAGVSIYVVGGFVRDLLMSDKSRTWPDMDLDLVVEGDAIAFAQNLAQALEGRMSSHREFMTALVLFPSTSLDKALGGITGKKVTKPVTIRVDVASARLEYYAAPAALPTVELSSLKMDLYRRDFTINAMAVQLNQASFGLLIDFFDGQLDIRQRRIRMLHALSFVEDPTRALRAVRFEQRYNFRIGPQADKLIRNAVDLELMKELSGRRVIHELSLMLEEKHPMACFVRMQEFDIPAAIHPQLDLPPWKMESLEKMLDVMDWHKQLYLPESPDGISLVLLAICGNATAAQLREVMDRLDIAANRRDELLALRYRLVDVLGRVNEWAKQPNPLSQLYRILSGLSLEGLLAIAARAEGEVLQREIRQYIYEGRKHKPDITGRDLRTMGLAPGPAFKAILDEVLAAKLDGKTPDRESQLMLAARLAVTHREQAGGQEERPRKRGGKNKPLASGQEDLV